MTELASHFHFAGDKVERVGWYEHRNQDLSSSWRRTYLAVKVRDDGYIYMSSQYFGEDWIFHDRVIVRIGERRLETAAIPSYSSDHTAETIYGGVRERNDYTNGRDNGILNAIASASGAVVLVRFAGDRLVHDVELTAKDKVAIKEAVELAALLRQGLRPTRVAITTAPRTMATRASVLRAWANALTVEDVQLYDSLSLPPIGMATGTVVAGFLRPGTDGWRPKTLSDLSIRLQCLAKVWYDSTMVLAQVGVPPLDSMHTRLQFSCKWKGPDAVAWYNMKPTAVYVRYTVAEHADSIVGGWLRVH